MDAPDGAGKIRSLDCHININLLEYDTETLKMASYHRGHKVTYVDPASVGEREQQLRLGN